MLLAHARSKDPQELKHATAYTDAVINFFADGSQLKGTPLPWKKTENNVRLRLGECSLWGGRNGQGKSQVLGHVVGHSIGQGHKWCIASMEFTPITLLARMYRQITAHNQPQADTIRGFVLNYVQSNLFLFDVRGKTKAKRILEVFDYARRRYGCTHFLLDSLAKCGLAEDDYNGQKALTDEIADFSLAHGVHVHLMAHARKSEKEDTPPDKMDIKGSGSLSDLVDNVFMVWRNKPKEQSLSKEQNHQKKMVLHSEPDCILTCCKQRHGEWEGGISLWFDRASLQYLESPNSIPEPMVKI